MTPAISDYVHKKLAMIEKHIEGGKKDIVAHVEVAKITKHHKLGDIFRAEVHLVGEGLDIYTEEETENIFSSIDKVKDEIILQFAHMKGKKLTLARRSQQMIKNALKFNWFRKKK